MRGVQARNIDEYIAEHSLEVRQILEEIRTVISKAAPQATEDIKYGLPTFVFHGNLVHFGAFKSHIGFYPTPTAIDMFKKELSSYEVGKGTIQFPVDRPIPFALIGKIVKFRVKENAEKAKSKIKKR
jgi:uncharacterized protein YdhG (YjbR/CyaY superfamily)